MARRSTPASPASAKATGAEPSLEDQTTYVLDEARMVLPGIQALFGFQLIAVFSDRFLVDLTPTDRALHLFAILAVAVAVALVMTPAAFHRQVQPRKITSQFLSLASVLITAAMVALMIAIAVDVYVVAHLVLQTLGLAILVGLLTAVVFGACWFGLPRLRSARRNALLST